MAWRPHANLVEGELDNTTAGRISGWLCFGRCDGNVGMGSKVTLDLAGDMAGELRGKRIVLKNPHMRVLASQAMRGFRTRQVGPVDSVEALASGILHAAWYDEENGRVVLELPASAWRVADEEGR